MKSRPEFLHHYTSIENLSLILRYQKIRFNSLKFVDDPTEGITADRGCSKKHYLISCWTESLSENIALWHEYGHNLKGCIISLPVDMFSQYRMGVAESETEPDEHEKIVTIKETAKTKITTAMYDLISVDYKEPKSEVNFRQNRNGDTYFENLIPIREKPIEWAHQNEWRFVLYQMPKPKNQQYWTATDTPEIAFSLDSNFPFDYFDLDIEPNAFKKMQIIMGPACSHADFIIANALVSRFNPDALILESKIRVNRSASMIGSGNVQGKHYSSYIEEIQELKSTKKHEQLEALLLNIVDATEIESKETNLGVAPRYYEELAKLYRKQKLKDKEISILKRYDDQRKAPGRKSAKLKERLRKLLDT